MEATLILLKQLITMFIFMGVGYVLFKTKLVTEQGSKQLSNILLYIVLPVVVVHSYCKERTPELLRGLAWSFVISAVLLVIAIVICGLIFGRRRPIENVGATFSNCGCMGIPLVRAVMGEGAVFYCSSFVAILLLLQWTYGVFVMSGDKKAISGKKIATNPVLIATIIGVLIFTIQIPIPDVVDSALGSLGSMNAPLIMIILGVYLAQTDIKSMFTDKYLYFGSVIRLVVVPLASMLFLCLLPSGMNDMKMTMLLSAAAPIGANVAIFAQIAGLDYTKAVKYVCLSTILCIITMPLLLLLASKIWMVS